VLRLVNTSKMKYIYIYIYIHIRGGWYLPSRQSGEWTNKIQVDIQLEVIKLEVLDTTMRPDSVDDVGGCSVVPRGPDSYLGREIYGGCDHA
jgi:hypothetical protein